MDCSNLFERKRCIQLNRIWTMHRVYISDSVRWSRSVGISLRNQITGRYLASFLPTQETPASRQTTRCWGFVLFVQQLLQILLRCGDGSDAEVFHQVIEHIGREERRQCGTQADVLDAQVQQGQQDAHRLLLVP